MKKLIKILTFTFICAMIFANVISAVTPYSTYTYSINGDVLESPDAYVPDAIVDSEYIGLDEDSLIDALADVEVDDKNNVYQAEVSDHGVCQRADDPRQIQQSSGRICFVGIHLCLRCRKRAYSNVRPRRKVCKDRTCSRVKPL